MKYDEIVAMWAIDAKIDSDKLEHESLNAPMTQAKYFNLYCREKAFFTRKTNELKKLKRWKRDYYLGEIDPNELTEKGIPIFPRRLLKSEVDDFVDTDDEVIKLIEEIAVIQAKVELLQLCVKSLNERRWIIKNAIDFLKFKNGMI